MIGTVAALDGCSAAHAPLADSASTLPEEIPEVSAGNGAIYQSGHDQALFETRSRDVSVTC